MNIFTELKGNKLPYTDVVSMLPEIDINRYFRSKVM